MTHVFSWLAIYEPLGQRVTLDVDQAELVAGNPFPNHPLYQDHFNDRTQCKINADRRHSGSFR